MIQLRFLRGPDGDLVVGPFTYLEVDQNFVRDPRTKLVVASFDLVNHQWYLAPGYDPSPAPRTYHRLEIEAVD